MGSGEREGASVEVLFRAVNERMVAVAAQLGVDDLFEEPELGEYFCECGRADCMEMVLLSAVEYRDVRGDPARFAVSSGHEWPDTEHVIARNERFAVVEKYGEDAELARRADARASAA